MKKGVKRTKKEKILIIILISTIVALTLVLGYDLYTSFKARAEARTEIGSLNNTIITLNQEKAQLIIDKNNLISERDALEQTVTLLNQQITQLVSDKGDLNSQLATLQADYNTLSEELQATETELEACLNP